MAPLLNEKLRKLREYNRYTQGHVSKFLNMTRQGYAHYEAGLRTPDHQTLLKLSKLYSIDISELINTSTTPIATSIIKENETYTVNMANSPKKNLLQLTVDERKILSLYRQLDPMGRKEIFTYLEKKLDSNKRTNTTYNT